MSKLFVYGVNSNCPRETLEAEFARCGEVTDVYITEKGYVDYFSNVLNIFSALVHSKMGQIA